MKNKPYYIKKNALEKDNINIIAKINEKECIGCTKCIQACPTDAIVGSANLMHSIIDLECSGCKLCIEPCPVNCISMIKREKPSDKDDIKRYIMRHNNKLVRDKKYIKEKRKLEKNLLEDSDILNIL